MIISGESYHSDAAGMRLYRHRFSPAHATQPVAGVVLMLHGLGDHLECHARAALEVFCPRGWHCVGVDWPGNGRSEGKRGHIDSVAHAMDILDEALVQVRHEYGPSQPVGYYAHSTGALILLQYLRLRAPGKVPWLWLSSPLLVPTWRQSAFKVAAAPIVARLLPRFTVDTGVRPPECFRITGTPEQLKKRFAHCHHHISLGFGADLIRHGETIGECAAAITDPTALLLTQGSADVICPPQFSEPWFERVPAARKRFALLPGLHHETLREPEDSAVVSANLWLDEIGA
ncbi:MAG: alpha/beta fold hydrolase [Verrucomicrobiales bacterium]